MTAIFARQTCSNPFSSHLASTSRHNVADEMEGVERCEAAEEGKMVGVEPCDENEMQGVECDGHANDDTRMEGVQCTDDGGGSNASQGVQSGSKGGCEMETEMQGLESGAGVDGVREGEGDVQMLGSGCATV
ncbi:hypothetical protein HO173_009059 [Letharia columbiana]|uniref:Uncharacterized protein n=1 Tax=Letharia columbiana TaxID=112416 RepID=A0A8H6FQK4_9LECA|nr:uncharacterized protein HO173_009059 [Letharia columbiana]KAF6232843.1 hypothetical protein HO173_009059 [Letharia columbiana]